MAKERPILFSGEMVRAILDGRKTHTRRLKGLERFNINPAVFTISNKQTHVCRLWDSRVEENPNPLEVYHILLSCDGFENKVKCPYGKTGDVLYVKETYKYVLSDHAHDLLEGSRDKTQFVYRASMHPDWMLYAKERYGYKWTPSVHMPKYAARIWLKVKDVRVERLNAISEADAIAEGVEEVVSEWSVGYGNYNLKGDDAPYYDNPVHSFQSLWQAINGPESWAVNPWVWVIEFEVLSTTGKPTDLNG